MWSSLMTPQGHGFMPAKHQQRDFGMLLSALPIAAGKSFKNPNFVNNFNIYQSTVKPVDSYTKNYQNSCHSHIIDSIKEQCPEAIPSVVEEPTPLPEESLVSPAMCIDNNRTKSLKRERTQRKKKQSGKHSKQNQKRQVINEMLQEEDFPDIINTSSDICPSPQIHLISLEDFIMQKPSQNMCSPVKKVLQSFEIPISTAEMVLTITKAKPPNRARNCSVTESEDSFIVFDRDGNEHLTKGHENNFEIESPCFRHRRLSSCESEDSFILFENDGDMKSHDDDDNDYCFESSDDESDKDSSDHSDLDDETDSSFSIVEPKKVRFATDQKLCEVHPMVKWSYAYQAARKGPWEMYARDRCRFKERAYRVEREIKHIFDPQHRARIYKERFEKL